MENFYDELNKSRSTSQRVSNISILKKNPTSPVLNPSSLDRFKKDLQSMFLYIRNVSDNSPRFSNERLRDEINNYLNDLNFKYANGASFKSDSIRVDMCKYFLNHMSEFRVLYKEMINHEKETKEEIHAPEVVPYSSNVEASKRLLMEQLITTYRNLKNQFPKETKIFLTQYYKATPKVRRELKSKLSREVRQFIDDNQMFFVDEETGIQEYLKNQNEFLSKCLKEDYIKSIISVVGQLKELNLLDKYRAANNKQFERLGLPELSITDEDFDAFYGNLSEEMLQKYNIHDLSVINSFWINRLSKEILTFNNAFFAINDLYLWDKIRKGKIITDPETGEKKIDVQVSDAQIEAVSEKMKFLSQVAGNFLIDIDEETLKSAPEFKAEETSDGFYRISRTAVFKDLSSDIDALNNEIGKDYKRYFSSTNGAVLRNTSNNFVRDFSLYHTALNITHNSYKIKDNIMIALLSNLFNSNISRNWGLSLENRRKDPTRTDKVLIAIDVPGFNMPIRLHMRRELLEDFLKSNQNTSKIPLYQGENDFNKEHGSVITTPMLIPVSSTSKKSIIDFTKKIPESHPYYKFLKHLEFILANDSYPEHLKTPISRSKKSNGKKKFITRYFDFADGKIYVDKGNDHFVEDTEYLSGGQARNV